MLLNHWLRSFAVRLGLRRSAGRRRFASRGTSRPLAFERLEDRTLMTVLTVNSLADNLTPGNGLVTLREAIVAAANDTSTDLGQVGFGADQIVFTPGLNGNINLNAALGPYGGALGGAFAQNLTITGNGAANTQIVGPGANSRVFVWASLVSADLTLENLTLRNGNTSGANNDGGAIYFVGVPGSDLTITNSTLSGNSTNGAGSQGGAVAFFSAGALNITNSTLSGNSTNGNYSYGGAVYVYGPSATVTVTNSTFTGNFTTGPNSHSGALHLASSGAADNTTLAVTNSTFTNNTTQQATSYAGAIGQNGASGPNAAITITNSTISGNTAGARGGGISTNSTTLALTNSTLSGNNANYGGGIYSAGASLYIVQSTFSGNIAATSGGAISIDAAPAGTVILYQSTLTLNQANGPVGGGGGISMNTTPGSTNLGVVNSIIAGNTAASGFGPEFTTPGLVLTVANSLIGRSDNTSLASTGGAVGLNGNIVGGTTAGTAVNPLLAPLANNGGPTFTHALLAGSPALNTGNNVPAAGIPNDQRGAPFTRIFGGTVDMGAFESQPLQSIIGNVATFAGTGAVDRFVANLGSRIVTANNQAYVMPGTVNNLQINGLGGSDVLTLVGTAGAETVRLAPGLSFLDSSSAGFTGQFNNIETIAHHGSGGADSVTFTDSAGNDRFIGRSNLKRMIGTGFDLIYVGAGTIVGNATAGGNDTAFLFDTAGNDVFNASAATASITNTNVVSNGFETAVGFGSGGNDSAVLNGSESRDVYLGRFNRASLTGGGLTFVAVGIDQVTANANGGSDIARLFGNAGFDTFTASSTTARLLGTGFQLDANNFETVVGTASGVGDIASLTDSAGNDLFVGTGNSGAIIGSISNYTAAGFSTVTINGINGGINRLALTQPLGFTLLQTGTWV